MARYSSGITAPVKELEPSLVVTFFRNHADKFIWAGLLLLLVSNLFLLLTETAFLAFLVMPVLLMLFSLTGGSKRNRYEISKQSIAEALTLPAYMPAFTMILVWLVFTKIDTSIPAVLFALLVPFVFIPSFKRTIRNHKIRVWNAMVSRLELAVIESVPFAEIKIASSPTTTSPWDEVEWETKRRRQEAFDAWLAVDLPIQRKLDLMAGGISPQMALDPHIQAMSAEDLLTLKAMSDLATSSEATGAP
jgi:hypothetical protein